MIGLGLAFATMIASRWGKGWFALSLGAVVAVMMVTYVAVPARLIGVASERSRRDNLTATAIGGALGAVVCSPPYVLGRIGVILLGSKTFFVVGVVLLVIAIPLQTGAVTATKAVKFSAKLVTGQAEADTGAPDPSERAQTTRTTQTTQTTRVTPTASDTPGVAAVSADEG